MFKYKIFNVFLALIFLLTLISCNKNNNENKENVNNEENINNENQELENKPNNSNDNAVVVYFSATNTTENVAINLKNLINSDIIEIIPETPYTSSDLNYSDNSSRCNIEQNDPNSRPRISNNIDISSYDVIYVGFPIWWGGMPKIMFTFFESYDFTNKTIMPFCTSGGTSINRAYNEIKELLPNSTVNNGLRVSNLNQLNDWIL